MKYTFAIVFLFLTACGQKNQDQVKLGIDKAKGVVVASGINIMALDGIKADTLSLSSWQNLFPVFAMPTDTSLRNYQQPLPGKYTVTAKNIIFKPDISLTPGRIYFARYYRYDEELTGFDMIMKHRNPGKIAYTELIFKY